MRFECPSLEVKIYLSKYLYKNCTFIKFMHSIECICDCAARTQKRDSPRARVTIDDAGVDAERAAQLAALGYVDGGGSSPATDRPHPADMLPQWTQRQWDRARTREAGQAVLALRERRPGSDPSSPDGAQPPEPPPISADQLATSLLTPSRARTSPAPAASSSRAVRAGR